MKIDILFGDVPQWALILDLGDNFVNSIRFGNVSEVLNVASSVVGQLHDNSPNSSTACVLWK